MECVPLQSWQRTLTEADSVLKVDGGSCGSKEAWGLVSQFAFEACSSRAI